MVLDEVKAPELLPVPEEDAADMLRRGLEKRLDRMDRIGWVTTGVSLLAALISAAAVLMKVLG